MALHTRTKLKYRPPSSTESFLNIPGTLEHLLTGSTNRPRLPDDFLPETDQVWNVVLFLIDGWGWKNAFNAKLPFVTQITKDKSNIARQIESGFPTTTTAMLSSLYLGEPP